MHSAGVPGVSFLAFVAPKESGVSHEVNITMTRLQERAKM
jgi:hypothetical protein